MVTKNLPLATELPHQSVATASAPERFLVALFDALWAGYRERVPHARTYERIIREQGATFVNDHVAFRTIALQQPALGVFSIARVFRALGYRAAGCYEFPDKHLSSIHFQHPNPGLPKLFVSELNGWELSPAARTILRRSLRDAETLASDDLLAGLDSLESASDSQRAKLLTKTRRLFDTLAWPAPRKADVLRIDEESQFGAWTLVHGFAVNHFTALVNAHGVRSLDNIDKTLAALRSAGVPMKAEIEGAPKSKLRQTATEAATCPVAVAEGRRKSTMPWTYAYFEIAERGLVKDPETGRRIRFEGFLGPQATHLFEMTRRG